ncbi:TPA: Em GEA1 (EM1) [Candidatus Berkelbacteria bacterium]|uniref:Em GEA1 (EM1) n=1 Tax=Berkelbacteria bacterium GW2011_GWE1_39_12 TaxID=1618337 RepID=A0A0G4B3K3_9BACT|nr:MAG: hypothetical protein UT28_C0001G0187 [Berkelbacteria bacterium GW2011_GWE1_39_12]HBO60609.1 Em GEA1 (EM1) [Candidatus Berkelbacteria bacterium]
MNRSQQNQGNMTVQEAGRKGGETTSRTHGREFYQEIGHKGGQKVRELIRKGEEAGGEGTSRSNRRGM